jgi:hypothetical protein
MHTPVYRTSKRARDLTLAFVLAICALTPPTIAEARKKAGGNAEAAPQRHGKAKQPKTQRSPSEETTAERDRRLLRECKGRPNAGACLGYASP